MDKAMSQSTKKNTTRILTTPPARSWLRPMDHLEFVCFQSCGTSSFSSDQTKHGATHSVRLKPPPGSFSFRCFKVRRALQLDSCTFAIISMKNPQTHTYKRWRHWCWGNWISSSLRLSLSFTLNLAATHPHYHRSTMHCVLFEDSASLLSELWCKFIYGFPNIWSQFTVN